jgi:xanthine dehydrogenase accessory factor
MAGTDASIYRQFEEAVRRGRLVAMATALTGPTIGAKMLLWPGGGSEGSLGEPTLDAAARERAAQVFASLRSERLTVETAGGPVELFLDVQPPPPRLWIVGAVHIAAALVT